MGPLLIAQLVKNPPAVQETPVQFWVGKTPEEGDGYPLQYSGLEKAMDCIVHGVAKSGTRLSNFHYRATRAEALVCQDTFPQQLATAPGSSSLLTRWDWRERGERRGHAHWSLKN